MDGKIKPKEDSKMYKCELIEDGVVKELFYRDGNSPEEVKEGLEFFQWPVGEWVITDVEDDTE